MSRKISVEDRTLTVEDTEGMFLILGSGVLMALLALSLESIYNCIERKKLSEDNESEMDTTPWPEGCDSWVTRELAFPGIKQRPMRGSV